MVFMSLDNSKSAQIAIISGSYGFFVDNLNNAVRLGRRFLGVDSLFSCILIRNKFFSFFFVESVLRER